MIITAGIYKGRKIISPDEKITRPTLSKVRMGIFNILYSILESYEGKSFLDLFGGSGIMGLEALSRGFDRATVVEINKKSANIIKKNYQLLGLNPDLILGDSLKFLDKTDKNYDVIYIDPPYKSGIYEEVIKKVKCGMLVIEHPKILEIKGIELLKQRFYGDKCVSFALKT